MLILLLWKIRGTRHRDCALKELMDWDTPGTPVRNVPRHSGSRAPHLITRVWASISGIPTRPVTLCFSHALFLSLAMCHATRPSAFINLRSHPGTSVLNRKEPLNTEYQQQRYSSVWTLLGMMFCNCYACLWVLRICFLRQCFVRSAEKQAGPEYEC